MKFQGLLRLKFIRLLFSGQNTLKIKRKKVSQTKKVKCPKEKEKETKYTLAFHAEGKKEMKIISRVCGKTLYHLIAASGNGGKTNKGKPASNSVTSKTDSGEDSVDMVGQPIIFINLFHDFEMFEIVFRIYELEDCLLVGQEAAHVSDVYAKVYSIMSDEGQQDYVPFSWVALAHVKKEHYRYVSKYI